MYGMIPEEAVIREATFRIQGIPAGAVREKAVRIPVAQESVIREAVIMEDRKIEYRKEGSGQLTAEAASRFHTEQPGRYEGTPSDGRITPDKAIGHLKTVLHHKKLVAEYCFQVGLYRQGILHDLSKFSPTELLNGFRYYQGGKQSPNNGERVMKGYSEAWIHHKGRNTHHYEYWTDYNIEAAKRGDYPMQPVRMPRRYVAEMLMDRIAASKNYMKENYTDSSPLEYYIRGKAARLMHPETAKELERMLKILKTRGEKECFRFVRDYYLRGGDMH